MPKSHFTCAVKWRDFRQTTGLLSTSSGGGVLRGKVAAVLTSSISSLAQTRRMISTKSHQPLPYSSRESGLFSLTQRSNSVTSPAFAGAATEGLRRDTRNLSLMTIQARASVEYPESDGQPIADKDLNRFLMEDTEFVLRRHFRGQEVYVSANLFIYYTQGEPDDRVAPDVFVVKGVAQQPRENYLLWAEGVVPQVVFEFVSKISRLRDRGPKLGLYAALGVREYYVFDPTGEWQTPNLRCFRLNGDLFEEIVAPGGVHSPELGLDLVVRGAELRFRRPGEPAFLRTGEEEARRAESMAQKLRELGIDPETLPT